MNDSNLDKIATHFDTHGDPWTSGYGDAEAWNEYRTYLWREKHALHLMEPTNRGLALDLGCGPGHALIKLGASGFEQVIGVDISEGMVTEAQALISKSKMTDFATVHQGNVCDLKGVATGSVDVCLALGVIEYQQTDQPMLDEIHRVLKPSGIAVIQMRNSDCYWKHGIRNLRTLVPKTLRKTHHEIFFREHRPLEFRKLAKDRGFAVTAEAFSHFCCLYPLTLIPLVRKFCRPLDYYLSKHLERFASSPRARHFGSMYLAKLKPLGNC